MTQPAEQTDFRYFRHKDDLQAVFRKLADQWWYFDCGYWHLVITRSPTVENDMDWLECDATGQPLAKGEKPFDWTGKTPAEQAALDEMNAPAPAAPGGEQSESVKVFRHFKCDCPGDQHWRFSGDNWQIAENLIDGKWEADTSMTLEDLDRPHYYEFTPKVAEPSPPAATPPKDWPVIRAKDVENPECLVVPWIEAQEVARQRDELQRIESDKAKPEKLERWIHEVRLAAAHNAFSIEKATWLAEICTLALSAAEWRARNTELERESAGLRAIIRKNWGGDHWHGVGAHDIEEINSAIEP